MARRPGGGRGPRAADRPRLRAQRARRRRDGRPGRGARRVAQRARPGSSSPASRRCSSTRSPRTTCPTSRASCGSGARLHQDALLRDLFDLGYSPVTEVAGRGEFARRGGIVDVFPPSMDLPIRIEFFGDEIDSLRAFDPTDQRTTGKVDRAVLLPASEFLLPLDGRGRDPRAARRGAARLGERLAADLARFEGAADDPLRPGVDAPERIAGAGGRRRRRGLGRPRSRPATGLDHIDPGTLLVLDEPGDIAEAAAFLWRQADERRAELVEAGELPKDWPSTYLPPRDWKGRLVASRTLELTWESEPPADVAMAPGARGSGDLFGWREPTLPLGRAGRLGEAVDGVAGGRRPDRPRLRPGAAARRGPRRGRPPGRGRRPRSTRRRRRARSPSSGGASTAGSPAGRTASPSSRTASCSGPSGSAARRPSAGSCRATSSSA